MRVSPLMHLAVLVSALIAGQGARAQSARQQADVTIAAARAAMLTDPRLAQDRARVAERQSEAIGDAATRATVRATALWLQGEAAYRLNDVAGAAPKLDAALALARQQAPRSKLEADILISRGSMHEETGAVVLALHEFQRAHAISLRLNDSRNRAIALICLATLYGAAKDYTASLKYFDQALAAFQGDPGITLSIQNNRAITLQYLHRYADAESGYRAAMTIAEQMHSKVVQSQILHNIARVQLLRGNLRGADLTVARGLRLTEADDRTEQTILIVAAQAAFDRHQLDRAADLVGRSFAGVDLNTTPLTFRDGHETAYQIYHALGRNEEAFHHLLALKRLDDQTTRLATSTGAALMAARFDFANQELRIARLKADDLERRVATARAQARVQRYIFYGGAGATAIVIAALLTGLIVVRRSRDQVRAANADLGLANAALGKALAAKTEFLATTSHEIRTPLNGILGMTQVMLADPALPEAMRDRLSVVQGAGTTMRALVDDILDVAKIENGKLVLEDAPFDLRATILDATRLWDAQAGAKGIAFRRTLDGCPAIVSGDSARVRQVVFNLLSNALKFTEAGEIAISACCPSEAQVAITVRDSGVGIPPDKLEAIFESFRQADAGTTRRFGGTGLGLAICRQLARAMGGDVTVESVVGEGSTFTVALPLAAAEPESGTAAGTPSPALLVVERNPIARSLFRTLLEPLAGRVVFAGSADEAASVLGDTPVSRVLIDDATLRASGDPAEALRRAVAAARGEAEITLLWPETGEAERQALLATGIDRLVTKPVSGPSLVATLFRESNDPLVRRAA